MPSRIEGAARALRLQAEGMSTRGGPLPDWIRKATDFTVDMLAPGSTIVAFTAPALSETPLFGGDFEAGYLDSHRIDLEPQF